MGKNLSNKYSKKLLDSAKKSATDATKTASKRAIQKTEEATGDLTDNKIADKITFKVFQTLLKNYKMMKQKNKKKKDTYLQKKGNKLSMTYGQYNNIIMEYQKIANLLNNEVAHNASNQPSKFRTLIGLK